MDDVISYIGTSSDLEVLAYYGHLGRFVQLLLRNNMQVGSN
jgi:hypothetical protein